MRNLIDYQTDLKKGWALLVQASEDIRSGLVAESGKLGTRFKKKYYDKKIATALREIGKEAVRLDQEDENFFAGRPVFKKQIEDVRELLRERDAVHSAPDAEDQE